MLDPLTGTHSRYAYDRRLSEEHQTWLRHGRPSLERATDKTVYLKGDKAAPYGAIMNMMDALRKAGIETVGLITEKRPEKAAEGGQ